MKKLFFISYLILISFSKQDEEASNLVHINSDYKTISPTEKNKNFLFHIELKEIKDDQEIVISLNSNFLDR